MATCDVRYGFFNLVDQEPTEITATSENAFFPTSNIKNHISTKVYRSETGTLTSSVVFDFKTSEEVNTIWVRPDLQNGFGFTGDLTIEANFVDSWASPPYSNTLSVNNELNFGILDLPSAEMYRFWRVTGTGSSYFELSNIFIGSYFNAGKNISLNWSYQNKDLSTFRTNKDGQRFINKYSKQKVISAEIKLLGKTGMKDLQDEFDFIGKSKPFWMVMDPNAGFSTDEELFAGVYFLDDIPSFKNIAYSYYNTSLKLREST